MSGIAIFYLGFLAGILQLRTGVDPSLGVRELGCLAWSMSGDPWLCSSIGRIEAGNWAGSNEILVKALGGGAQEKNIPVIEEDSRTRTCGRYGDNPVDGDLYIAQWMKGELAAFMLLSDG